MKAVPDAKTLVAVAGLLVAVVRPTLADNPRCASAPYGDTMSAYNSYITHLSQYAPPAEILSLVCNMKLGGTDRTPLYDLGLSDGDIDDTPTTELAARILAATSGLTGR